MDGNGCEVERHFRSPVLTRATDIFSHDAFLKGLGYSVHIHKLLSLGDEEAFALSVLLGLRFTVHTRELWCL